MASSLFPRPNESEAAPPPDDLDAIEEVRRALREQASRAARRQAEREDERRRRWERAQAQTLQTLRALGQTFRAARAGGRTLSRRLAPRAAVSDVETVEPAPIQEDDRERELERLDRRQLTLRIQKLGPDHPDVATAARIVAAGYMARGRRLQAIELYERARSIIVSAYGAEHPEVTAIDREIAELRDEMATSD